MVSLQWLFNPASYGTALWTGIFGTVPTLQGIVDNKLQHPGKAVFGAGDADIDVGSTGRVHITTLIFLLKPINGAQLGVSAITCPPPVAGNLSIASCTAQIIDTTGSDRPWITSDGKHVYISYHVSRRMQQREKSLNGGQGCQQRFAERGRKDGQSGTAG